MTTSRRQFLKGAAATAAFTILPRHVLGGKGYIAPSDQLTKGIIGVGGMGTQHYDYTGDRLVAICDVDKNHLADGAKLAEQKNFGKVACYDNFMDLIHDPNVDIVHIATPPHWHAIMSIEAAKAGK
ncbi:MAG: Gfo/Idh/MocA family oxidoreductase, partial [Bacteroidales bacterium]|nr:Gfo/Idh/MocA family oxidoreductase [Bacteroidales bacterium]